MVLPILVLDVRGHGHLGLLYRGDLLLPMQNTAMEVRVPTRDILHLQRLSPSDSKFALHHADGRHPALREAVSVRPAAWGITMTSRRSERKRPLLYVGIGVLVTLAGLWVYLRFAGRSTLDQDAKTIIEAALENDPRTVYRYAFDFQKEALKLSEEDFCRLWSSVIWPALEECERIEPIQAFVERGDHQGVGWTTVRLKNGVTFELSVVPYETGNRGGVPLLDFLLTAWDIKYVHSRGLPLNVVNRLRAWLEGIASDRPQLEACGVVGWQPEYPGKRVVPWDATIAHWQRLLDELSADESGKHVSG